MFNMSERTGNIWIVNLPLETFLFRVTMALRKEHLCGTGRETDGGQPFTILSESDGRDLSWFDWSTTADLSAATRC